MSSYFTTEAQIIMSDWTKMQQVADRTNDPTWKLRNPAQTQSSIELATRRTIYQALVPLAYPVLYDLGTGITHASDWICRSDSVIYPSDQRLFSKTGTGAEVGYLVPSKDVNAPQEEHLIAVGAAKTVGTSPSAYVPAPSDTLTSKLFVDPDDARLARIVRDAAAAPVAGAAELSA